jgi:spore germination protein KB
MKIDYSSITPRQLFFSITCFIQSSALLTTFFSAVTNQDSWLAVLIGIIMNIPLMILLSHLMKMYPDKTLVGICCEVFGKTVGKIFSVFYLGFFLLLCSLNLNDLGTFVQSSMMQHTPTLLVVSLFMLVCAQAVKGGAQVITRYSFFFTCIAFFILVIGALLSIPLWRLDNFLPIFQLPFIKYLQGTHVITAIPLAETTVFLMFTPSLSKDKTKLTRYLILALLLGAINLLVVVMRNTAVLGNTMYLLSLPPFEVFRLINVTAALSRMEILFALSFITLFFFKICVIFYAATLALAEIFGLKSYQSVVYLIGGLIIGMSFNVYVSNVDHGDSARRFTAFVWMPPEIILPLALFIGGKIKQQKKKQTPTAGASENQPASPPQEAPNQP